MITLLQTSALAVMVHKVNNHPQGNIISLYRFIDENGKFILKSELATFSIPDPKTATSFSTQVPDMFSEELFISHEEEGWEMAPDMFL